MSEEQATTLEQLQAQIADLKNSLQAKDAELNKVLNSKSEILAEKKKLQEKLSTEYVPKEKAYSMNDEQINTLTSQINELNSRLELTEKKNLEAAEALKKSKIENAIAKAFSSKVNSVPVVQALLAHNKAISLDSEGGINVNWKGEVKPLEKFAEDAVNIDEFATLYKPKFVKGTGDSYSFDPSKVSGDNPLLKPDGTFNLTAYAQMAKTNKPQADYYKAQARKRS